MEDFIYDKSNAKQLHREMKVPRGGFISPRGGLPLEGGGEEDGGTKEFTFVLWKKRKKLKLKNKKWKNWRHKKYSHTKLIK